MTLRAYYATHEIAGFTKGAVLLIDDTDEHGRGLAQSGYFAEIKDPEPEEADDAAAQGPAGA